MRYFLIGLLVVALVTSAWTGVTRAQTDDETAPPWTEVPGLDDLLAQAPGAPGPGMPAAKAAGLRQRLGLTEAQAQRVEQVLAAHRERVARLRIAQGRARLDARELSLETKPDRAKIEAVSRRIGDLYGQMVRARLEVGFELRAILTPEQWSRFREMNAQRMRARRDRVR